MKSTNQAERATTIELPSSERMFQAFTSRDAAFDGVFFTGVKTTGIFCRPTCRARKPLRENIEFFPTAHEALVHGYRPCRVCEPLAPSGHMPAWIQSIVEQVHADPSVRTTDSELRREGVDPVRLRRWFKSNVGVTFHDYCRSLRVGKALSAISQGDTATGAAFDVGYESLSGFSDAVRQIVGAPPSVAGAAAPVMLSQIPTPLGTMIAGATDEALVFLEFSDRRGLDGQLKTLGRRIARQLLTGRSGVHDQLTGELAEYFQGDRRQFETPVFAPGTPFQTTVWEGLREIPFGQTRSYARHAAAIGKPDAVRAVARANGANRIAILIPCHRVIGADGKLTGYAGGLWRKQRLLDIEAGRVRL